MSNSRRFADELVERAFAERFPEGVPGGLGGAVLDRISGCLRAEGFSAAEAAQHVFASTLDRARQQMESSHFQPRHEVGEWFRELADQALREYQRERVEADSSWIVSLLEGHEALGGSPAQRAMATVRLAIGDLSEPYRRFVHEDFVEQASLEEIRDRLGFASLEETRRFKREAFAALKDAVRARLDRPVRPLRSVDRER